MSTKKITDFTEKTSVEDTDLFLTGNQGTSSLRKLTWSNILNGIKNKFTSWTFSGLNTTQKGIIDAINEVDGVADKNASDLSSLTSTVGTNTNNISQNASDIETLQNDVTSLNSKTLLNLNDLSGLPEKTNLVAVDLTSPTAEINSVHRIYAEDASVLIGSPVTSGIFIAKWECIWYTDRRLLVKLTEYYPNYGRIWHNHFNYQDWDGWKLVGGCTISAGSQGFTLKSGGANNSFLRQDQSTGRVELHLELTGINTDYTAVNVSFAVIPEKYRPERTVDAIANCYDTSQNAYIPVIIRINTNGDIAQVHSSNYKITDIYMDAFWYINFNNYEVVS